MSLREQIDAGLDAYRAVIRADPVLEAELEASVVDYFGGPPPLGAAVTVLMSARRHLEWFLFERHSPSLLGAPSERLLDLWRARMRGEDLALERALLQSTTGMFEVTGTRPGEGAWLRDLTGFGEYPLDDPVAGQQLAAGDLLVGRLFPVEDGLYCTSRSAGVFRGAALRKALERDLARAREGGGPKVLRLSQHELERMFWGSGHATAASDPLAEARALLAEAGYDAPRVERTLARLARAPFRPDQLLLGATDVLGELLDEMAFETHVDLGRARSVLAHAWAASSAPSAATPAPAAEAGARDVRAAVDAFAAGRAAGADLATLFGDLERDLGLDGADDDEADTPAPDFPGVVGAVVEEFRWEIGRVEGEAAAARHAPLDQLATYAEHIGVFEELDASHLLRFTCFWLHERDALQTAEDARELLASLGTFCGWVEENHEHPLATDFGPVLEGLQRSLPRIVALNRHVSAAPEHDTGELYEVVEPAGSKDLLRDRRGEEHHVRLPDELRAELVAGDRLRATIALDGSVSVFRCYPPEAAGLGAQ